jgi:hypothetical protein
MTFLLGCPHLPKAKSSISMQLKSLLQSWSTRQVLPFSGLEQIFSGSKVCTG